MQVCTILYNRCASNPISCLVGAFFVIVKTSRRLVASYTRHPSSGSLRLASVLIPPRRSEGKSRKWTWQKLCTLDSCVNVDFLQTSPVNTRVLVDTEMHYTSTLRLKWISGTCKYMRLYSSPQARSLAIWSDHSIFTNKYITIVYFLVLPSNFHNSILKLKRTSCRCTESYSVRKNKECFQSILHSAWVIRFRSDTAVTK